METTHAGNSVRLAVANLSFDTTEGQIKALFDLFGDVLEVQLIRSRASGRFRCRASVWMADQSVRGEVILPRVLILNGSQLRVLLLKPNEMEDVDLGPAPRRFKRLLY